MADLFDRIDPFTARVRALPSEGSVRIQERPGLGIATIMARGRLMAISGLTVPEGGRAVFARGLSIVATGPGTWLRLQDAPPPDWAETLEAEIGEGGSVVDQSSAYAVLRMGGEGARSLLGRGAFVDFYPDQFRAGSSRGHADRTSRRYHLAAGRRADLRNRRFSQYGRQFLALAGRRGGRRADPAGQDVKRRRERWLRNNIS